MGGEMATLAEVNAALRASLDPSACPDAKRGAQQVLAAWKSSDAGLHWAVQTLDAGGADEAALWLASEIVLHVARFGGSDRQALLRQRLWSWLRTGSLPHFVLAKITAALSCLACQCWPAAYPEFWGDLQQCLAEQQALGLKILTSLLEEFQSTAQATSAGFRGQVLAAHIPGLQARYSELQPAAAALLHSLLCHSQGALGAAQHAQQGQVAAELAGALEALPVLRKALSDFPPRTQQQVSTGALLELLFGFACCLDLAAPGAPAVQEACSQVAAAAMDCIGDIVLRPMPPQQQEARQVLELLVAQLPVCLSCVQRQWERAGPQAPQEDPALAACARLLSNFATVQLRRVAAAPQLQQDVLGLLGQVCSMMFARRRPGDVLAFAEVWHAVLDHLDSFEDEGDREGEGERSQQGGGDPYKAMILHVSQLVLATLFSPTAQPPSPGLQPPFSVASLDASEGSGAALEEWLQSVGGEAGEEGGDAVAVGAQEEEEEEILVPGSRQNCHSSQSESEQDVYIRLAEGFLGRVAATYSSHMLPLLLLCFAQHSAAFAQACSQLATGARAAGVSQHLETAGPGVRAASRDLEVALRLLGQCGASLPLRGLGQQASLADLAAPGGEVPALCGAHAGRAFSSLLDLAGGWQHAVQLVVAAGGPAGAACLEALAPVGARIYRTLGALTATWLSRLMLTQLHASGGGGDGDDVADLLRQLAVALLSAPTRLLSALGAGACQLAAAEGAPLRPAALAAAESLVPLTSIALSSSMKPPAELLLGLLGSPAYQALQQAAAQSLPTPYLPTRALRALWLALSDLSLRSWAAQPASTFPGEECSARFAAAAAPLAACFADMVRSMDITGGAGGAEMAVRRAAATVNGVVLSYAGTPKHVRGILYRTLVGPLLGPTLALLRHCISQHARPGAPALGGRAGAGLLRLLGSVIDVLALELGPQGVEQLLSVLVDIYGTGGGDASMESDLALMQLLTNVMGQGGNKHSALLMPSLHFCFGTWQRAGQSRNADACHIKGVALASLLSLLRHRWRQLSNAHVQPLASSAGASTIAPQDPSPLAQLHQQLHASAAAAAGGTGGATVGSGEGGAAIGQVMGLLQEYMAGAAVGQVVLAAADVRLVLEELYELQVVCKLYQSPHFQGAREPLLAALLGMLLSRLYTAAQNDLVDTLFSMAAANWSDFHLSFLPRFVEHRLARLGPTERSSLLGLFGVADLDAPTFEKQALAFMNDVLFYEQATGSRA